MKLRLIEKRPEAGDAMTLVFEPEQPVTWRAGQYLEYNLPHDNTDDRGTQRWFTISAAPFEKNIQITTRFFEKRSSLKRHLHELEVGQTIEAGEPEGDFVITDPLKRYVFIAGGIGITPLRSILAQAAHDGINLDVELLYGNRSEETAVFLSEIKDLALINPDLRIHNVVEPNRIDEAMIKNIAGYSSRIYYVSGPEPMVKAMATILDDLGIPGDQQKLDDFPGYQ